MSPDGTTVNLRTPYTYESSNPGGNFWFDIGVAGFYGENMAGNWTLIVTDYNANGDTGTIDYAVKVFGN